MFQNPKKEFNLKFNEESIKEAILKIPNMEPNDYSLVKNDIILNEIRIHRKGQLLDLGYHVDFTLSKISDEETKVAVEVSRNLGAINTSSEVSISNNILKSITSKFSAYLSGDVNKETGKANVTPQGCYVATSIYGSYDSPEVLLLRKYRDTVLSQNTIGRIFIKIYYLISPTFVSLTKNMNNFNRMTKLLLDKIVRNLEK